MEIIRRKSIVRKFLNGYEKCRNDDKLTLISNNEQETNSLLYGEKNETLWKEIETKNEQIDYLLVLVKNLQESNLELVLQRDKHLNLLGKYKERIETKTAECQTNITKSKSIQSQTETFLNNIIDKSINSTKRDFRTKKNDVYDGENIISFTEASIQTETKKTNSSAVQVEESPDRDDLPAPNDYHIEPGKCEKIMLHAASNTKKQDNCLEEQRTENENLRSLIKKLEDKNSRILALNRIHINQVERHETRFQEYVKMNHMEIETTKKQLFDVNHKMEQKENEIRHLKFKLDEYKELFRKQIEITENLDQLYQISLDVHD